MRVYVRPTLAFSAVVILVLALRGSFGFWPPADHYGLVFFGAMAALAVAFTATVMSDHVIERGGGTKAFNATDFLLTNVALVLVGTNVLSTGLLYADDGPAPAAVTFFALLGLIILVGFTVRYYRVIVWPGSRPEKDRSLVFFCIITLLVGFLFRERVLKTSPDPIVDVYALARDNADHLLHGRNPYQNDIVSPYETKRAACFGVGEPADPRPAAYPPHAFLAAVPFRLFGADPRWPNVIGDMVAAIAVFGVAWKRGRPLTAYLAATIWLFIPRSSFIIEQSWFEPMLAGLFGLGFSLSENSGVRKWLGYICLGLALTAKQFGLPLLPALAWPHRKNWLPLLVGLATGAAVVLPFVLWSPSDFIDIVVTKHLGRPPQYHSITVASTIFHFAGPEAVPDRKWLWIAAMLLIGAVSLFSPRDGAATALGLGTALMIFSTFHTQGFPNYFYLVEYLWLLGGVGLLPTVQPDTWRESGHKPDV